MVMIKKKIIRPPDTDKQSLREKLSKTSEFLKLTTIQ